MRGTSWNVTAFSRKFLKNTPAPRGPLRARSERRARSPRPGGTLAGAPRPVGDRRKRAPVEELDRAAADCIARPKSVLCVYTEIHQGEAALAFRDGRGPGRLGIPPAIHSIAARRARSAAPRTLQISHQFPGRAPSTPATFRDRLVPAVRLPRSRTQPPASSRFCRKGNLSGSSPGAPFE